MSMVSVNSIKINERIRDDMGDIEGLAESLKKFGLLHPIVVDETLNLIAGHRRLQAVNFLGWEEVEVRFKNQLSEKEKREIELEENTKRKDLTELEKSKNLMELVVTAKEVLKDDFQSPGDQKQIMEKGRPEKPDSLGKVAERIGIPKTTIVEAKQHVQAVEKYPVLEHLPKKEAIRAVKEPDKVEQFKEAIEEFPELKEITMDMSGKIKAAENLRQMPPEERKQRFQMAREAEEVGKSQIRQIDDEYKEMKKIRDMITRSFEMKGIVTNDRVESWLKYCMDRTSIESAIEDLDRGITELTKLRNILSERLQGPKKVVGLSEVRSRY